MASIATVDETDDDGLSVKMTDDASSVELRQMRHVDGVAALVGHLLTKAQAHQCRQKMMVSRRSSRISIVGDDGGVMFCCCTLALASSSA